MKRILSLVMFTLFLNGCDDGNLTQENISFDAVSVQNCDKNSLLYKLKNSEALIFEASNISFPTETTYQEIPISQSNRILYRFYSTTVTAATLCEAIAPAIPVVTDQWMATTGKIIINTTAIKSNNETENSTKITGYNHHITFENIIFNKANGNQTYKNFTFGDYVVNTTGLPFGFTKVLKQCSNTKQLYDKNSSEALILDIDPTLIVNAVTLPNTPRIGLLSDTKNKLTYRLFSGLLKDDYFCTTTYPLTPLVIEEWIGVSGVANTSGIIEVSTTLFGNAFKHTVVIKRAKLKRGTTDFLLGDNYLYGELLTTN